MHQVCLCGVWLNTKLHPPGYVDADMVSRECRYAVATPANLPSELTCWRVPSTEDLAPPIHAAAPHKAVADPTLHTIAHSRGSAALCGARRPTVWLQGFGGHYQSRPQLKGGAAHGRLRSTSDRLFRCFAPSCPIPLVSKRADLALRRLQQRQPSRDNELDA